MSGLSDADRSWNERLYVAMLNAGKFGRFDDWHHQPCAVVLCGDLMVCKDQLSHLWANSTEKAQCLAVNGGPQLLDGLLPVNQGTDNVPFMVGQIGGAIEIKRRQGIEITTIRLIYHDCGVAELHRVRLDGLIRSAERVKNFLKEKQNFPHHKVATHLHWFNPLAERFETRHFSTEEATAFLRSYTDETDLVINP